MPSNLSVGPATSFKSGIRISKVTKQITPFTMGDIYTHIDNKSIDAMEDSHLAGMIQESFGKTAILINCPPVPILEENARRICAFISEKTGIKITPPEKPMLSRDTCSGSFDIHVALEDAKPKEGSYKLDIGLGETKEGSCA